MKYRNFEIHQTDGRLLAHMEGEPIAAPLGKLALEGRYKVSSLCARIGVSDRHLRRVFENDLGLTPLAWLKQERMVAARYMLREGTPLKQVAGDLGFSTARKFAEEFRAVYGVTPREFRLKESRRGAQA